MLEQARANCVEHNCTNVIFAKSDDNLSHAEGQFDLVHSCLVLQHLEVARGRLIFSELVGKVAVGGCGVIQVTFGWDIYPEQFGEVPEPSAPEKTTFISIARGKLRRLFPSSPKKEVPPADPEMQMNYYSMSQLMFILQRAGIKRCFRNSPTMEGRSEYSCFSAMIPLDCIRYRNCRNLRHFYKCMEGKSSRRTR